MPVEFRMNHIGILLKFEMIIILNNILESTYKNTEKIVVFYFTRNQALKLHKKLTASAECQLHSLSTERHPLQRNTANQECLPLHRQTNFKYQSPKAIACFI